MTMTITRQDIIPLHTYRQGREDYLQKMIPYKKARRVRLDDYITLLFENKNTVLFQILELMHCEDLEDQAEIDEYIEIYSGMLPNENELSATLFIELDDQLKLQDFLKKLKGIEHHLSLVVGDETIPAVFEEVHDDREFTTSVHYLKFPLTETAKQYLLNESSESLNVTLNLNHPQLTTTATLSQECLKSLQKDLS
ncbi:DUF3501 family protein [Schinkia sp. CFF1]